MLMIFFCADMLELASSLLLFSSVSVMALGFLMILGAVMASDVILVGLKLIMLDVLASFRGLLCISGVDSLDTKGVE